MVKKLLVTLALLAACSSDGAKKPSAADAAAAYPPGPYALETLGTLPQGMSFDGLDGPINLDSLYEPKAAKSRIAIIRTSAAWCGTCQWHAAHTDRLTSNPRVVVIDLLVADRDNAPADKAALADWRTKINGASALGLDPHFSFGAALSARGSLPAYTFIDTKTMKILRSLSNPTASTLADAVTASLHSVDGGPAPDDVPPQLHDGLFDDDQLDLIKGMQLVDTPPPDPTNQYADNPQAAALGKLLFNDKSLSPSGTVSCATCHDPSQNLIDGKPQSVGVAKGERNSPSIGLAAHSRWQFWDGRADTLWSQALGPFENPVEFGSSRLFVAHRIADSYASQYQAIFGADPKAISALPAAGKPNDPAFDALSADDKDKVNRIYVNVGKAIAAHERTVRLKRNQLDAYAAGDMTALSPTQKESLLEFFVNGCAQCHYGPRLTDDAFHDIRFPTGHADLSADDGRADGLSKLAAFEFAASSKWSDAPSAAKKAPAPFAAAHGQFKTPTLRGVATSAPFGHGGTLATIADVAAHYSTRGIPIADARAVGTTEDWVPAFDHAAADKLPAFLEVLTGDVIYPN